MCAAAFLAKGNKAALVVKDVIHVNDTTRRAQYETREILN